MAFGVEALYILGALVVGQLYAPYLYFFNQGFHQQQTDVQSEYPLLCYFSLDPSWPDNGTLHPAMNATICTHMIFISSSTSDCKIAPADPNVVAKYFSKIPILRELNPQLKIMLSNGGGNFSQVLVNEKNRTIFVDSIIPFLKKYDFDGVDIDWEFFGWNGLPVQQRANFTIMMQAIREKFDLEAKTGGKKYILSAAVAAGRAVMAIYDVPALNKAVDFVNLMCYDYNSYALYDPITGYNSPLYPTDWDKKIVIRAGNVGWSTNEWVKRGMPKNKIMVGIPTYTHTWTLEQPDKYHGLYAPAVSAGKGCDECKYSWVCEKLQSNTTNNVWDNDAAVPYFYYDNQWVSYDNVQSLTLKSDWIIKHGYGGIMVYSLNNDDVEGTSCHQGKFPLISSIKEAIQNNTLNKIYDNH